MMLIIKKHGAPTLHTLEGGRQVTLYALCHVSAVTSSSCQRAAHRPCGSQPAWRSPAARPRASPAPRSRRVAREAWGARPKALGVKARARPGRPKLVRAAGCATPCCCCCSSCCCCCRGRLHEQTGWPGGAGPGTGARCPSVLLRPALCCCSCCCSCSPAQEAAPRRLG